MSFIASSVSSGRKSAKQSIESTEAATYLRVHLNLLECYDY